MIQFKKNSNINNKQDLGFIIPVHIPQDDLAGQKEKGCHIGGAERKEKKKIHAFT